MTPVGAFWIRNLDFRGLHRTTIGLTSEKKNAKSEDKNPDGYWLGCPAVARQLRIQSSEDLRTVLSCPLRDV